MKKTLSSVLSIILVFVFAFMAVSSSRSSGKKFHPEKLPVIGGLFGNEKEEEKTQDNYGFSEFYETYPVYTFEQTEETEASTTQPSRAELATEIVTDIITDIITTIPAPVTATAKPSTRPDLTSKPTSTAPEKLYTLTSATAEEVVNFYNDSVVRSYGNGSPEVYQSMSLRGDITGNGGIAPYIPDLQKILETDTSDFSGTSYGIPGAANLETDSVKDCYAISAGGKTKIRINFKEFSVSMADMENINNELPAEFNGIFEDFGTSVVSGKDTVKLSLVNSYIDCDVDEKTGEIIRGEWVYDVDFVFGNAEMKLSDITLSLIDFRIPMRLRVTIK